MLLGEGPSWEPETAHRSQEFQSLVGITAATSLLTSTGPVRVAKALGLCSGCLRQHHLPLCFPKSMPRTLLHQQPFQPRPDAAQLAFFCSQNTLTALGMSCPSLYLSCDPISGQLPLVWDRGSDSMCQKQAFPGVLPSTDWENWGQPECPFPFCVLKSLDSETRLPSRSPALAPPD